jgi:hypothetical protein
MQAMVHSYERKGKYLTSCNLLLVHSGSQSSFSASCSTDVVLKFGPWLKRVAPRTLLCPAKPLLAQERAYVIVLKQSSFPAVFSRRKSHRYSYSNSYRFSPGSLHSAFSLRTCQFNGRRGTALTLTRRKSGAQEPRMWFIMLLLLQPAKVSSTNGVWGFQRVGSTSTIH